MNPVAAGGVVAWVDGESLAEIVTVALREGGYGCHVPLVFASDLEACQQRCVELVGDMQVAETVARERMADLTAAQAEADRLREALRELSAMYTHAWDLTDGGLLMMAPSIPRFEAAHAKAKSALVDIHAANTKEERRE